MRPQNWQIASVLHFEQNSVENLQRMSNYSGFCGRDSSKLRMNWDNLPQKIRLEIGFTHWKIIVFHETQFWSFWRKIFGQELADVPKPGIFQRKSSTRKTKIEF